MSTTYVNFTPAERAQARATDLAEFLRRQGYDLRREGRGSVWMRGGKKVSVQGNLWYNQYTRDGGDAIDFARRFFDCPDYPSAVRFLLGADVGVTVINPQKQKKEKEPKPFVLPPANSDMHLVYAYLMKQRGIDRDVIIHAFTHAKLSAGTSSIRHPFGLRLAIILYILWMTVVLLWNMLACFANFNAGMNIDKSFLKFLPRRVLYSFCRAFGLEVKRISCYTIVKAPPHNSRLAHSPAPFLLSCKKLLPAVLLPPADFCIV